MYNEIRQSASSAVVRRLDQLSKKGVSTWLNALPLDEHGYHLSEGDFRDELGLRCEWHFIIII